MDYFPENRKGWAYKRLLGSLKVRASKLDMSPLNPAEQRARREAEQKAKREKTIKEQEERERKNREEKVHKEKEAREKTAAEERARIAAAEKVKKEKEERERVELEEQARKEKETRQEKEAEERAKREDEDSAISKLKVGSAILNDLESMSISKLTPGGHRIYRFDNLEFVQVPKGEFFMGTEKSTINLSKLVDKLLGTNDSIRHPQHNMIITYDYWISRYPITNAQYEEFDASKIEKSNGKEDCPVVNVSWLDAQKFIAWLNKGYSDTLPNGYVFRLPSEAEWEKAARGVDGREWPWGNTFEKSKCNTAEGGMGETTPVSEYSPQGDSPYGAADMVGNVWEWTSSLYKIYPYNSRDGREDKNVSGDRVIRGGSFTNSNIRAQTFYRGARNQSNPYLSQGFRVVVAPPIN